MPSLTVDQIEAVLWGLNGLGWLLTLVGLLLVVSGESGR
jgi:hypothetical protein